METKLTEKQKRFCDYYIETGNAADAYVRAGYKNYKSAGVEANKTLKNPKLVKYIESRNKALESNRIADMAEVKEFWTSMLRDSMADSKDRLKASEYIAKTNAAFIDKVEEKSDQTIKVKLEGDLEEWSK